MLDTDCGRMQLAHAAKQRTQRAQLASESTVQADALRQADHHVHAYATQLMAALAARGNNVAPVQRKLNELQHDLRSHNHFADREVDTFDRLGFR